MIKLNLGCGNTIKEGYVNIDLYIVGPDTVHADISNLSELYEPGTVDEIFASDIIEHFTRKQALENLKHWIGLLKPGGIIYIKTPNIVKQIECYVSKFWDEETFSFMVFGGQDHPGNFHYTAFSQPYLKNKLIEFGMDIVSESDGTYFIGHGGLTTDIRTSGNANFEITAKKR